MQAQPSSVATRNGVIAGILLGILSLPVITLSVIGRVASARVALPALFLLIALVVFAIAGFSAARRNGLIRSGVWAGFLAALLTAFVGFCLGVVIVTLLSPYVILAAPNLPAARRAGHIALAVRLVITRLGLGALILLASGAIAGTLGGLLGRIGRPRASDGLGAAYTTSGPTPPPAQGYAPAAPFSPPAQGYAPPAQIPADAYMPSQPPASPPPLYYPTPNAYENDAPTTVHDYQA